MVDKMMFRLNSMQKHKTLLTYNPGGVDRGGYYSEGLTVIFFPDYGCELKKRVDMCFSIFCSGRG